MAKPLLMISMVALTACGGASSPAKSVDDAPEDPALIEDDVPDEAAPESVDSGFDCAKAEAVCEGGVCTVTLNNTCEGPVTCELRILALCRGETEVGEARGVGRDTVPPGQTVDIQAGANCEGRAVAGTQVDELTCR